MDNLANLQTSLDNQTQNSELLASLLLASERVDMELRNYDKTIKDIESEFSYMPTKEITKAIRNGALGKFGLTYKFNTQIVCYWIREYQKEKNKSKPIL
jgi:hypothetical protein